MSEEQNIEPGSGNGDVDADGASQLPTNRPAENARIVSASDQQHLWTPGEEATDFLGLNLELDGGDPGQTSEVSAEVPDAAEGTATSWLLDQDEPGPPVVAQEELWSVETEEPGRTVVAGAPGSGTPDGSPMAPAAPGDPNWLLGLDDNEGGGAGTGPVIPGSQPDDSAPEVPSGFEASYVEPEPKSHAMSRFAYRGIAAAAVVVGGLTAWQLFSNGGSLDSETSDPLRPNRTARTGTTLVTEAGPTPSDDSGARINVAHDGTERPDRPPRSGVAGSRGPAGEQAPGREPGVSTGEVPRDLADDAIAQEARDVLDRLDQLLESQDPSRALRVPELTSVTDVLGPFWVGLAAEAVRVRSAEGSVAEADPVLELFPDSSPVETTDGSDGVAALDPSAATDIAPSGPVTDDVRLTEAGPDPAIDPFELFSGPEATAPSSGVGRLGMQLLPVDRSILDQYLSWRMAGSSGGERLSYTARIGGQSSMPPTAERPFLVSTIGTTDLFDAESGPLPVPGFAPELLAGSEQWEQPVENDYLRPNRRARDEGLVLPELRGTHLRRGRLSGHWYGIEIPREALAGEQRLLTPNVGRVRAVYANGEVFEGQLFGVGQARIWIDTSLGRMTLEAENIAELNRIDSDDSVAALGAPGSQDLAGLPRVRVRAPGGYLVGHQLARDGEQVTLLTDGGNRITLLSDDIAPAGARRSVVGIKRRNAR